MKTTSSTLTRHAAVPIRGVFVALTVAAVLAASASTASGVTVTRSTGPPGSANGAPAVADDALGDVMPIGQPQTGEASRAGARPTGIEGDVDMGCASLNAHLDAVYASRWICRAHRVFGCPAGAQVLPDLDLDRALLQPEASTPVVGMVVFFSGGSGTAYWNGVGNAVDEITESEAMLARLHGAGYQLLLVRWRATQAIDSWQDARGTGLGVPSLGYRVVSCRPATVMKWAKDEFYAGPRRGTAGFIDGVCGYCVVGSSGGASALAYTLSRHGLDTKIDGAFFVSGPPQTDIFKGCTETPTSSEFGYSVGGRDEVVRGARSRMAKAWGLSTGICVAGLPAASPWDVEWVRHSIVNTDSDSDYRHPHTRIYFEFGQIDPTSAVAQGAAYLRKLVDVYPGNMATADCIAGMEHPAAGPLEVLRLEKVITWNPAVDPTPPGSTSIDAYDASNPLYDAGERCSPTITS